MPFKYETEKRKDNRGQPYARKQLPNWNSLPILRAHCRLVQIFGIKRHKLPFIIILYIKYIYTKISWYMLACITRTMNVEAAHFARITKIVASY